MVDTASHPGPYRCSADFVERSQPVTIVCHGLIVCSVLLRSYRTLLAQPVLSFLHPHCLEVLVFKSLGNAQLILFQQRTQWYKQKCLWFSELMDSGKAMPLSGDHSKSHSLKNNYWPLWHLVPSVQLSPYTWKFFLQKTLKARGAMCSEN